MAETYSIKSPDFLHITDGASNFFYGGSQGWYRAFWKRMGGCGPTTGANLLYYLAKTRTNCEALVAFDASVRSGFLKLLEESWRYITPGMRGVDSPEMFGAGIKRFGQAKNIDFSVQTLSVGGNLKELDEVNHILAFIEQELQNDLPIAFLNLDRGTLTNLESWHWVTLVGYDLSNHKGIIYDQGKRILIDLKEWIKTTKRGGGFVTIAPANDY